MRYRVPALRACLLSKRAGVKVPKFETGLENTRSVPVQFDGRNFRTDSPLLQCWRPAEGRQTLILLASSRLQLLYSLLKINLNANATDLPGQNPQCSGTISAWQWPHPPGFPPRFTAMLQDEFRRPSGTDSRHAGGHQINADVENPALLNEFAHAFKSRPVLRIDD